MINLGQFIRYFKRLLRDYCSNSEIFTITAYFNQVVKKKNSYLFHENDIFNHIYFIKEGKVMIEKKINKNKDRKLSILFNKKTEKYNIFNREIIERSINFVYGVKELKENLKKNYFSLKIMQKGIIYRITVDNIKKCFEDFPGFKKFFYLNFENEVEILNVI